MTFNTLSEQCKSFRFREEIDLIQKGIMTHNFLHVLSGTGTLEEIDLIQKGIMTHNNSGQAQIRPHNEEIDLIQKGIMTPGKAALFGGLAKPKK